MLKLGKKGIETIAVVLILVVLSGVLLGYFTIAYGKNISGVSERETCRQSVLTASKLKLVSFDDIDLKCDVTLANIDTEKKEEVMKGIADEMYWCWYMFGKGEIDFSSNWDFYHETNSCFPCSVVTFGAKTKKLEKISGDEFRNYLRDTKLPSGDSYYDYLTKGLENLGGETTPFGEDIDLTKDYYVFYGYSKTSYTLEILAGTAVGGGIIVLIATPASPLILIGASVTGVVGAEIWERITNTFNYIAYLKLDKEAALFGTKGFCQEVIT